MTEVKRIKKAKEILKEIISICYDSESINLHEEIASLERGTKNEIENVEDVAHIITEIHTTLEILSDDVDMEDYIKIEEFILEFSEMN